MKSKSIPITPTEARRSLEALEVLSGKVTEPPKPRQKKQQHEAEIQQNIFEWAALNEKRYPELKLLYASANGGKRDPITGYYLKKSGVRAGLPDLNLPVPRNGKHGLFIELKAPSGRLQDNQRVWLDELSKQGYTAVAAYGFDEAVEIIKNYLSIK